MTLDFGLFRNGARIAMPTPAQGVKFSKGRRGAASAEAYYPLSMDQSLDILDKSGLLEVIISDQTAGEAWRGRVEDIGYSDDGVSIKAFGYGRAFSDPLYTSFYSKTGSADWKEIAPDETPIDARPDRYQMDNNNRLYFAQQKGSNSSSAARGVLGYWLPDKSAKACATISVDYDLVAFDSVEYALRVEGYTDAGTFVDGAQAVTSTTASGTLSHTFGANVRLVTVQWYRNSATPKEYTGETGESARAICTNIRIKSATGNILASDIAADLVAFVAAENPDQVDSTTALIVATAVDLQDEIYEDARPSAILDALANAHGYEWGVQGKTFYFRPINANQRTWYATTEDVRIENSLNVLRNKVYTIYRNAGGRIMRTATAQDDASVLSFGLKRTQAISTPSTSSTTAEDLRDAALEASARIAMRADADLLRIWDGAGNYWRLWQINAGDLVVVNDKPALSAVAGNVDTLLVDFVEYDVDRDAVRIEPANPTPTVANMLAGQGQVAGGSVTSGGLGFVGSDLEIYNVADYGARGDGSSVDITAVQNAINAAGDTYGVVYFPKGTYPLKGVEINNTCTVIGSGPGTIIKALTDTTIQSVFLVKAGNCRIANMVIDGDGLGRPAYAIEVIDAPNTVIENVEIRNFTRISALALVVGIYIKPGSDNAIISNCYVHDMDGNAAAARGVYVNDPAGTTNIQGTRVMGCTFADFPDVTDSDAIAFAQQAIDSVAANNHFHNVAKRAVKAMGARTTIEGNTIYKDLNNLGRAAVSASGSGATIANNVMRCVGDGRYEHHFDFDQGDNVTATGNVSIQDTAVSEAYSVNGGAGGKANFLIANNIASGCTNLVRMRGDVDKVTITGNAATTTQSGVATHSGATGDIVVITGNYFNNTSSSYVTGAGTSWTIANNQAATNDFGGGIRDLITGVFAVNNVVSGVQATTIEGGILTRWAASAPSSGAYKVGDRTINTTPSEAGGSGSMYVVHGWVCVTAGSPGTWLPQRTLTGN